jgi:hypothetical protein
MAILLHNPEYRQRQIQSFFLGIAYYQRLLVVNLRKSKTLTSPTCDIIQSFISSSSFYWVGA